MAGKKTRKKVKRGANEKSTYDSIDGVPAFVGA
jgi:hypothetical protein